MKNLIVVHLCNPLKTIRKDKYYFKKPKLSIYIGKVIQGFPLSKYSLGKILTVWCNDICWKDKYNSPRFEFTPQVNIVFFKKWQIFLEWKSPVQEYNGFWCIEDCYWEAILWYLYYNKSPKEACKLVSGWEKSDGSKLTKENIEYLILK